MMFVQNHMTPNPTVISPEASVADAWQRLNQGRFHQLPVVDSDGQLIGIVSDRDIRSATGFDPGARMDLRIEELMTADPITITEDATIEEALQLFCRHHFGALPVLNGKRLSGIITRSDLLRAFHELLGLNQPGSRIEVAMPNGTVDLAHVIQSLGPEDDISSMIAARLRTDGAEPVLYIHTRTPNPWRLEQRLRSGGAILLAPESARGPSADLED